MTGQAGNEVSLFGLFNWRVVSVRRKPGTSVSGSDDYSLKASGMACVHHPGFHTKGEKRHDDFDLANHDLHG